MDDANALKRVQGEWACIGMFTLVKTRWLQCVEGRVVHQKL